MYIRDRVMHAIFRAIDDRCECRAPASIASRCIVYEVYYYTACGSFIRVLQGAVLRALREGLLCFSIIFRDPMS